MRKISPVRSRGRERAQASTGLLSAISIHAAANANTHPHVHPVPSTGTAGHSKTQDFLSGNFCLDWDGGPLIQYSYAHNKTGGRFY